MRFQNVFWGVVRVVCVVVEVSGKFRRRRPLYAARVVGVCGAIVGYVGVVLSIVFFEHCGVVVMTVVVCGVQVLRC